MPTQTADWFDAHLDLAFLAETGRDMHAQPDDCRGRYQPVSVTLPSLRAGGVRSVLATVFTEAVVDPSSPDAETGAFAYPLGNRDAAYVCGMRQLKLYHAWQDAGVITLPNREPSGSAEAAVPADQVVRAGVLVENADPITDPDELELWVQGGVVAVGLAWTTRGHYASGNGVPSDEKDSRLTDAGRALVARMDKLGVVHDASHLNDRSLADLLDATGKMVIASHSNCRALLGDRQRHLTDDTIREIVARGGVIGVNLCSAFLDEARWETGRATIADAVRHVEHICTIAGNRDHVGLGSDMDGGFAADRLPEGIDTPADLARLADALRDAGWNDADIAKFRTGNWRRIFDLF